MSRKRFVSEVPLELDHAPSEPLPPIPLDDRECLAFLWESIITSQQIAERSRAMIAWSFEAIAKLNRIDQPPNDWFREARR